MHEDTQTYVLSALRTRKVLDRYRVGLKEHHFENQYCASVYRYILSFFDKYGGAFVSKRKLRLTVEETGEEGKMIRQIIKSLPTVDAENQIVHDKISEMAKEGIIKNVIYSTFDSLEGKKPFNLEGMIASLHEAQDLDILSKEIYDYTEEISNLHRSYGVAGKPINTLVSGLDDVLGLSPTTGEEWIVVGPPGRGKTQLLLNVIYSAATQGMACLYITAGDQGREVIQNRVDAMISGINYFKLRDPNARIMGLIKKRVTEKIISKGGKIFIQDWSDTSCTPDQIESLVNGLPGLDVLAVDYPDIMKANSRYKDRRHEIASIFNELRRLAVKKNILVWAGSQANRSSLDKRKITMKDVAEDIQKCWVADGIITFCQTEEEKEEEMARLFIAKARRPPLRQYEIPIEVNEATGRIS